MLSIKRHQFSYAAPSLAHIHTQAELQKHALWLDERIKNVNGCHFLAQITQRYFSNCRNSLC